MNVGDEADDDDGLFWDGRYENVLNTIRALSSATRTSVSPEAAIGLRVYQGLVHTYWVRRIRDELTTVYTETMANLQLRMNDVAIMLGDEASQYQDDEISALMIALRESLAEDEDEDEGGPNTQEAIDLVAPSPRIATETMPKECAVCFEGIKRLQTYRQLECSHYFHKQCIDQWFQRKLSCPMCRHSLI